MKHTLTIFILTIFMVIMFQQKSLTADGELKTCKEWVEKTEDDSSVYNAVYNYSVWKVAYFRFKNYPTELDIDPEQFCKLFGENMPKTEHVTRLTELPCHKWIIFNGYSEDNTEQNIILAQTRDTNNLDAYISDYAFLFGKFLLGQFLFEHENKGPLKPLEYCTQILGMTAEKLVDADFKNRTLLRKSFPALTQFIFY